MNPVTSSAKLLLIPDRDAPVAPESPVVVRRFRLARLPQGASAAESAATHPGPPQ